MTLTLYVKRLNPSIPLPQYRYAHDAAFDLCAREKMALAPGERVQIPTGLCVHIPEGYVGLVWDRSGLSHKYGLKTLGGVIDSGYRGEVKVGLINLGDEPYTIEQYHRIAQMIIQKKETPHIVEVDDLEASDRGNAGFGSTGY